MSQTVVAEVGDTAAPPDDEDDPYSDRRWREVLLQPYGPRWEDRLPGLVAHLLQEAGPADRVLS